MRPTRLDRKGSGLAGWPSISGRVFAIVVLFVFYRQAAMLANVHRVWQRSWPRGPAPGRASARAAAAGVMAAVLWLLVGPAGCADAEVRRMAAKELGCPEKQVSVSTEQNTDTSEIYRIKGCGKAGKLHCGAPDYLCFFVPDP